MKRHSRIFFALAIIAGTLLSAAGASAAEKRLALVIGNASYKDQPLATAANDAALISQTLQLAGFDVIGARDLDQGLLREAFRRFTDKVAKAGAGATVFVYFAGYGAQLAGQNYLIPVGAEISEVADLPARASSLSDVMHALSALNPKSTFIVLDAGRPGPFVLPGQAGGLAWTEPDPNMLIAFSTAPGTMERDAAGSYGAYARALAEMIREGGLTPASLFDRVRLRVHELTNGGQVPWNDSKIQTPFRFLERAPGAPERNDAPARTAQLRLKPMLALGAQNAYMTALMRDTFDAYTDFLADYWQDPMTKRVRALLAARRESITWQRTCQAGEAVAYWSYLDRYPSGPHAAEATRLLTRMGAATTPPAKFERMDYDVPPPLPDELEYIAGPGLILDDPSFGFDPPPPTPISFLEPPPQDLLNLQPPSLSAGHVLPVVNLTLQASVLVPLETTSPTPSNRADESWPMKPAIDLPGRSNNQVVSSLGVSVPAQPSQTNADVARGASSVEDGPKLSKIPGSPSENQEASHGIISSRTSASQPMSTAPLWFTDIMRLRNHNDPRLAPATYDKIPMGASSMFAPAAAGLTIVPSLQTTQALIRSNADEPPQSGSRKEASTATPSPRMTAGVPQTSSTSEKLPPGKTADLSDQGADTSRSALTGPTNQKRPAWLTDVVTVRKYLDFSGPPMSEGEISMSAPTMFASASAGLTFQTWQYGIPSSRRPLGARRPLSQMTRRVRSDLPGEAKATAALPAGQLIKRRTKPSATRRVYTTPPRRDAKDTSTPAADIQ